ncbi:MAG: threonine synthase [Saprospiraceae bacterium]|nr:threonine synthase [Candidatus Opimibacter iunctus]
MKYISTNDAYAATGFKSAVIKGIPKDGGLFVPDIIPQLDASLLEQAHSFSIQELAFHMLSPFTEVDLTDIQLKKIIAHTFQFDIPLRQIGNSQVYALELFHGPTWAFKDVGARFLAGCLSEWNTAGEENIILVATSGDTGGAVANGFYQQQGIKVVILYPAGRVSPLQEMQIAGLGGNITALAIDGSFDDCQSLVKKAFSDTALRNRINLTSANSINVARWLPQMIFYALAWIEARKKGIEQVICIPSGNYGNIAAAYLAHDMGFNIKDILAAHNANDTIPRYLTTGEYKPGKTISTLANAMDVNDPSNFVRLQYLQQHQFRGRLASFQAQCVTDEQILNAIREVWERHKYLLDPHTATAWHMLNEQGGHGIIVATAHPYKFENVIVEALGYYPEEWTLARERGQVSSIKIPASDVVLRDILLDAGTN